MAHTDSTLTLSPPMESAGEGEDMESVIMAYLRDQRRANLSRATIVRRRSCVFTLMRWLDPKHLRDCTDEDIAVMLDERNVAPRTRYHWISHLHSFCSGAVAHGHLSPDPTATLIRPRLPQLLPRPISDADLAMALACACPMMRAWLCLGALAGLRCAEIANLDASDVLIAQGLIRVYGKGGKERLVPLHDDIVDALRAADARKHGPLWPEVTPARLSKLGNEYLAGLGIDDTMHSLRHWFGTKTYAECKDIRVVQELLGHASPTTTAMYAAWDQSRARATVARIALPAMT